MDLYEQLRNRKILLIEEDPWVRDSLSLFVRSKGCRLLPLESVAQGVAAIALERFDIVLCNHRPPATDGLAFLARVGIVQPEAIRVLLTFSPAADYTGAPGSAGIHDFLQKPLTIERLESSLSALMGTPGANGDLAGTPGCVEGR